MQPERSADAVTRQDRHDDDARDAEEQARSGGEDRREAERRAEQYDRDLQHGLGPESDAGKETLRRGPGGADRAPEQDRQHQGLRAKRDRTGASRRLRSRSLRR